MIRILSIKFRRVVILFGFSFLQEMLNRRRMQSCEGCGTTITLKMLQRMNDATPNNGLLCNTCARVRITCLICLVIKLFTLFPVNMHW